MNSSMVKPEKFEHLNLVYHFTTPLNCNASLTKWLSLRAWNAHLETFCTNQILRIKVINLLRPGNYKL